MILDVMKNINQSLTIDCIKKIDHNLRSQFAKEKKALNASKKSGCGTEEVAMHSKIVVFQEPTILR